MNIISHNDDYAIMRSKPAAASTLEFAFLPTVNLRLQIVSAPALDERYISTSVLISWIRTLFTNSRPLLSYQFTSPTQSLSSAFF